MHESPICRDFVWICPQYHGLKFTSGQEGSQTNKTATEKQPNHKIGDNYNVFWTEAAFCSSPLQKPAVTQCKLQIISLYGEQEIGKIGQLSNHVSNNDCC